MGGMENPDIDNTQPTHSNPKARIVAGLDETVPTPAQPEAGGEGDRASNLAETIPVPVEPDHEVAPGQETGEAPPASENQDDFRASEFDATMVVAVNATPGTTESGVNEGPLLPPPPAGVQSFETPATVTGSSGPPSKSAPNNGGKKGRKRSPWAIATLLGLLALVLIAALSAFAGYRSGITLRKEAEVTQVSQRIDQQYQLGLQEMSEGQYNRARQRFEYVIQLDPNYPGVTEKLADVLLQVNITATPTIVPTPTLTPTPDLRSVQDLYTQSQEALNNGDWSKAIDALLTLRKNDPNYQAVQVDDMLFMALRNRGKDKIGKLADLEGGIYDLSLAERFGPLDSEAQGFQTWARLYITGASFWDIDWKQAVYYFAQVAPALPNLRDGSGMTANERYRQALIGYGNMLAKDDPCGAQEQYQLALSLGPDAKAEEALGEAVNNCSGGQDEQQSSGEKTAAPQEATATTESVQVPAEQPTAEQPTVEPPTSEPPTAEPPTAEPPTPEPPTSEPPTAAPAS